MWRDSTRHGGYYSGRGRLGPGIRFASGMPFGRRFPTQEERIARLEEYLKALQAEAKGVEERIAELKKTPQPG